VSFQVVLAEPERGKGLTEVQVGLAGGNQADPGGTRPDDDVRPLRRMYSVAIGSRVRLWLRSSSASSAPSRRALGW